MAIGDTKIFQYDGPAYYKQIVYGADDRPVLTNMCDRGDCENTISPMVKGETIPVKTGANWERSALEKNNGIYSFKFTKTNAIGNAAWIGLTDSELGSDLHGFPAGSLVQKDVRIKIPSASGILGSEIELRIYDYKTTWESTGKLAANLYDQWQMVTVTRRLRNDCIGTILRIIALSTAAPNEHFYVDDIGINCLVYGSGQPLVSIPAFTPSSIEYKVHGGKSGIVTGERWEECSVCGSGFPSSKMSHFQGRAYCMVNGCDKDIAQLARAHRD